MKNILIIGSQHGNEPLGEMVMADIPNVQLSPEFEIHYEVGNPRAVEQNVRFTESDMNRSYDPSLSTYESKRAQSVLKLIDTLHPELVLDLHTTNCEQPPSIIAYKSRGAVGGFIAASSIRRIVHMPSEIAEGSLIGSRKKAVSIEVSNADLNPMVIRGICEDIVRFTNSERLVIPRQYFDVVGKILKTEISEDERELLQNFRRTKAGYFPFLAGESSYKKDTDYLGFKLMPRPGTVLSELDIMQSERLHQIADALIDARAREASPDIHTRIVCGGYACKDVVDIQNGGMIVCDGKASGKPPEAKNIIMSSCSSHGSEISRESLIGSIRLLAGDAL